MTKIYWCVATLMGMILLGYGLDSCNGYGAPEPAARPGVTDELPIIDTTTIPAGEMGRMVRYGRDLMYNTAYYIGPRGINGHYLGNRTNCTNCHQDAGTKPFAFNLMSAQDNYPQYRAREGKVLTLAERINNCVTRPHNGKPLPLDSKEMVAILCYLKWINTFVPKGKSLGGETNLQVKLPDSAASPARGKALFAADCARCHGANGEGTLRADLVTYVYPPLWGPEGYQPGSSMHRVIKMAQWIKANMPYDKARWNAPYLSDAEALDIAAFVNDDQLHQRPFVKSYDYPNVTEKAIDYDKGPFADGYSDIQHKYGPYQPIINARKSKGLAVAY